MCPIERITKLQCDSEAKGQNGGKGRIHKQLLEALWENSEDNYYARNGDLAPWNPYPIAESRIDLLCLGGKPVLLEPDWADIGRRQFQTYNSASSAIGSGCTRAASL